MQLTSMYFTLLLSTLATGLPLDGAQEIRNSVPRAKSYAVVNVDGGSSTPAPGTTTVIDDQTKTVQVTDAASTVTDISTTTHTVTTTVIPVSTPVLTPASSTSSSSTTWSRSPSSLPSSPQSTTNISPTPTSTSAATSASQLSTSTTEPAGTSLVTVVITEKPAPTHYYDDGFWHTRYAVKTHFD